MKESPMTRCLATWLVLLFIGVGFAANAVAAEYSQKEAAAKATSMAAEKQMPPEKIRYLVDASRASYNDPWFKEQVKKQPVKGVIVYSSGEGGFVVKYMKGEGLASFKNGHQNGAISVSSWSAGAIIGGSATGAVGLVMGLQNESDFGGEYTGKLLQATAADGSTPAAMYLSSRKEGQAAHALYILVSSRGFAAEAGGTKLQITPKW